MTGDGLRIPGAGRARMTGDHLPSGGAARSGAGEIGSGTDGLSDRSRGHDGIRGRRSMPGVRQGEGRRPGFVRLLAPGGTDARLCRRRTAE